MVHMLSLLMLWRPVWDGSEAEALHQLIACNDRAWDESTSFFSLLSSRRVKEEEGSEKRKRRWWEVRRRETESRWRAAQKTHRDQKVRAGFTPCFPVSLFPVTCLLQAPPHSHLESAFFSAEGSIFLLIMILVSYSFPYGHRIISIPHATQRLSHSSASLFR